MSEQKKYSMVQEGEFYRIRALIDIPEYGVKVGDYGGVIEDESNLTQDEKGWISKESKVEKQATVHDAFVTGKSLISDASRLISGTIHDSTIKGTLVQGSVKIFNSTIENSTFCLENEMDEGTIHDSYVLGLYLYAQFNIHHSEISVGQMDGCCEHFHVNDSFITLKSMNIFKKCLIRGSKLDLDYFRVSQKVSLFFFEMETDGSLYVIKDDLNQDAETFVFGRGRNPIRIDCQHLMISSTTIKGNPYLCGNMNLTSCEITGMPSIRLYGKLEHSQVSDLAVINYVNEDYRILKKIKLSGDDVYE